MAVSSGDAIPRLVLPLRSSFLTLCQSKRLASTFCHSKRWIRSFATQIR
ncbi:hypothetical protein ACP70R_016991 [Stipagrostis hirtigluma subsp. patula]